MRNEPNFVLNERTASGIVNFPSVHAGLAMLLIWAAWPTKLRYPVLLLNAVMIIAALTHGAHYLADVISGLLLAVATIGALGLVPATLDSRSAARLSRAFDRA